MMFGYASGLLKRCYKNYGIVFRAVGFVEA